ncbi:MAG: hypothetical protein WC260_00750 [Candidatus Pacearchaeota archaeon]
MYRKSFPEILIQINDLLKKEKELSINQIALKLKSQWRTAEKSLEVLKKLGIVSEKPNKESNRQERIFYRLK